MLEWFARTTRRLDRVLIWVSGLGFLGAVMSWLATQLSILGGLPWPEAIFLGIAAALVIGLAISGIGALRRAHRQPPARKLPFLDHDDGSPAAYDDTALRAEIAGLRKVVEKLGKDVEGYKATHANIIRDYNRMDAGQLNLGEQIDEVKKVTDKLPVALYALYQREQLTKLAKTIEDRGEELFNELHDGAIFDAERWAKWERDYNSWDTAVRVWVENGRWYAPDVAKRVLEFDDGAYDTRNWNIKDSQFPETETTSRSEAVRRFKKFRIIRNQWDAVREEVDAGVIQVAFIGLSEQDARRRPPRTQT
ncbi:MAG TPA: hypothetical protein VK403_09190 [Allosphingosinicella sp.]|nr:hypothetical protein [Allosphingosinicella sp.]